MQVQGSRISRTHQLCCDDIIRFIAAVATAVAMVAARSRAASSRAISSDCTHLHATGHELKSNCARIYNLQLYARWNQHAQMFE